MKSRQDAILLLSNHFQLRDLLRSKLPSINKSITLLNKNSLENVNDFNIKLTIIDDNQNFEILRNIVTSNTAVLLKENSLLNFKHIFSYNINFIIELPINENLLCAIVYKSFGLLKDKCPEFVLFHNLKLCLSDNYILYKESKINLTQKESSVMYELMTKQSVKPQGGMFNERYLQVTVFRINKKFKECTNMKIIKSKYGVGYYISI